MNIRFRYSWIYDQGYRNSPRIQESLSKQGKVYPSIEEILNYIKKIEPEWKKVESKVLKEISTVSGLKWTEKEVLCYVIGFGRPFSDPLTINIRKSKNRFIDQLIHEMLHQITTQNPKANSSWKTYLDKNYSEESRVTKNHIFVHALHKKIYLEFFNKKRLNLDVDECQDFSDYKRSWEIVEKEGYENIIKTFRQITK